MHKLSKHILGLAESSKKTSLPKAVLVIKAPVVHQLQRCKVISL